MTSFRRDNEVSKPRAQLIIRNGLSFRNSTVAMAAMLSHNVNQPQPLICLIFNSFCRPLFFFSFFSLSSPRPPLCLYLSVYPSPFSPSVCLPSPTPTPSPSLFLSLCLYHCLSLLLCLSVVRLPAPLSFPISLPPPTSSFPLPLFLSRLRLTVLRSPKTSSLLFTSNPVAFSSPSPP